MKSFIIKFGSMIASLALAVITIDANTCSFFLHQPKLPVDAKKLRGF